MQPPPFFDISLPLFTCIPALPFVARLASSALHPCTLQLSYFLKPEPCPATTPGISAAGSRHPFASLSAQHRKIPHIIRQK